MKSYIFTVTAVLALIFIVGADISEKNEERTSVEEDTVKKVHALQPGEKEYLSPNLIGVQNIAITNIPVSINFINIIDAFREVVDGVRYEIFMNAVNTTDNNTEIICHIIVLEKPWITTIWGDKVRLLQKSNCTDQQLLDSSRTSKVISDKYQSNSLFGFRNELTVDRMFNIESQIVDSSNKNPQMIRQHVAIPIPQTTESINVVSTTEISIESEDVKQTNSLLQSQKMGSDSESTNVETIGTSSIELTSTEKVPELKENEKKWLDDFLSVGSLNIETSFGNKNAFKNSNEEHEQVKKDILGGVKQLDADEIQKHQDSLTKSLEKLDVGETPKLTIEKCHSGSSQVVAGTLIKLDCDIVKDNGEKDRCLMSFWRRSWLENGDEVTLECKNSPKSVHRQSRSIKEKLNRKTRQVLLGGPRPLDANELKEEEQNLSKTLTKLNSEETNPFIIENCHSGTTQIVSGSLTKLNCTLVNSETGKKDNCTLSLWSQLWLKETPHKLTVECKDQPKTVHRYRRSIDDRHLKRAKFAGGVKPLTELELKEQEARVSKSLAKIAAGDGPSYSISRTFNGTKQTVAGSLVKLFTELIDENTGSKENCSVSVWERPWIPIDGFEVSFECKDKQKSVHRHSRAIEYAEKKTNKKSNDSLDKAEHLFQKFQVKYKKEYHNGMERQMRLRIFKHNLKLIHDLNKNEMGSAKYGITEFADMTTTEYRGRTGLMKRENDNKSKLLPANIPDVKLPKEFDWREKGAVSKVKNQGNCGSCWAFSVIGNIEGLHAVKTGKLEEYSEQELLDCDTIDSACNGGLPDNAYKAIENIGGLELESEYPYQAKKNQCRYNNSLSHVKIVEAVDLPKNETEMAKWLVKNGPISIGINANAMQFYRGGVSHPWKMLCSKKNLDHGVLIVGYGVSEYPNFKKTLPYWIVKNSWGSKWGEQGYYRVYRGDNTCGVGEMATSAVLA